MLDGGDTDDRQIIPRQSSCAEDARSAESEKPIDSPSDFVDAKTGGHERH